MIGLAGHIISPEETEYRILADLSAKIDAITFFHQHRLSQKETRL